MPKSTPTGYMNANDARLKAYIKVQDFCDLLNGGAIDIISTHRSINGKNLKNVYVKKTSFDSFQKDISKITKLFTSTLEDKRFQEVKKYILLSKENILYRKKIEKLEKDLCDAKLHIKKLKKNKKTSKLVTRIKEQAADLIYLTTEIYSDSFLITKKIITRGDLVKKCKGLGIDSLLQTNNKTGQPRNKLKSGLWPIFKKGFKHTKKLYKTK